MPQRRVGFTVGRALTTSSGFQECVRKKKSVTPEEMGMTRKRRHTDHIIGILQEAPARPKTFSHIVRRPIARSGLRQALPLAGTGYQFSYQEILYSVPMFLRRLTVSLPPGEVDVTLFEAQNYIVAVRHRATEKTGFTEESVFGFDSS
jgi:hypothetical protein